MSRFSSRRQELRTVQLRQRAEQPNRNSARTNRRYQQGDSPLRKSRRRIGTSTQTIARTDRWQTFAIENGGRWTSREDTRHTQNPRPMSNRHRFSLQEDWLWSSTDRSIITKSRRRHRRQYAAIFGHHWRKNQWTTHCSSDDQCESTSADFPLLLDLVFRSIGTKHAVTWTGTKSNRWWPVWTGSSRSCSSSEYVSFSIWSLRTSSSLVFSRDDRRDPDDRDDKADDELKPLTREELKQRALEQVKNLERKALQEQNKYSDLAPTTAREKSSTGASRGAGGETGKASTARAR